MLTMSAVANNVHTSCSMCLSAASGHEREKESDSPQFTACSVVVTRVFEGGLCSFRHFLGVLVQLKGVL